jgi:hypothetical protein
MNIYKIWEVLAKNYLYNINTFRCFAAESPS